MNCKTCNDYIIRSFDKSLNEWESAQLKQHLKGCKFCEEEYESLKEILNIIEDDSVLTPPHDFEEKVMIKVTEAAKAQKRRRQIVAGLQYTMASLLLIFASIAFMMVLESPAMLSNIGKGTEYVTVLMSKAATGLNYLNTVFYSLSAGFKGLLLVIGAVLKTKYSMVITLAIGVFVLQNILIGLLINAFGLRILLDAKFRTACFSKRT